MNTALLRRKRLSWGCAAVCGGCVPDRCAKMASLYNFMYRRLVDANLQKNAKLVDDALEVMRHQGETWVMLMEKISAERAGGSEATMGENAAGPAEFCAGRTKPGSRPISAQLTCRPSQLSCAAHQAAPSATLCLEG